jgi:DNA-directed RNA polymerase subunit omega
LRRVSAVVALLALSWGSHARAHESPAEPPLFARGSACIERVDKREIEAVQITYQVAFDDTQLVVGDIDVPDAKTHQFFAFAGSLVASGFDYTFHPHDIDIQPVRVPVWITVDDVKRAAQASGSVDATGFSASDVPAGAVLDAVPELDARYVRVTEDDARVPITLAQAGKGVSWALSGVPAGVYTLAGYTFSPPYNAWTARTTKVKVLDAATDVPAMHVEPLRASLFATQGLRVRGCLDVPEGSELRGDFAVDERPEAGWVPWLPARPASTGELELCFHNPRPELTGSLRVRFALRGPDGATFFYYAPDPITALPGGSACSEAGNVCCDFEASGGAAGGSAGAAAASGPTAGGAGVSTPSGDGGAGPAGGDDARPSTRASPPSGCSVLGPPGGARGAPGVLAAVLLALALAPFRLARTLLVQGASATSSTPFEERSMARVTVEDCLEHEENRFALCILAAKRTRQLNRGVPALVESKNRAAVTSLREIAASRVRYSRAVKKLVEDYITESKALVDAQDG